MSCSVTTAERLLKRNVHSTPKETAAFRNSLAKLYQPLPSWPSCITMEPHHPPLPYSPVTKKHPNMFAHLWTINALEPSLEDFKNSFMASALRNSSLTANNHFSHLTHGNRTHKAPAPFKNTKNRYPLPLRTRKILFLQRTI